MLDQCIITVPNGPLVKPEIFTDEKFEIDGWLQFYAVNNSNRREFNKEADRLSNLGMDVAERQLGKRL